MIRNRGEFETEWISNLCNKVFVEKIIKEGWRRVVIVPYHKAKGDNEKHRNYGITNSLVIEKTCDNS